MHRPTRHSVQRGNDRQPCLFTAAGRQRYRHDLREIALRKRCAVQACVPMTNHLHLLMTPEKGDQVARVMQVPGRRYVRHVNDRYLRTGTLLEGGYESSLVDCDTYLCAEPGPRTHRTHEG